VKIRHPDDGCSDRKATVKSALVSIFFVGFLTASADAKTLVNSAICGKPKGHALGWENGREFDQGSEGMDGGSFTFQIRRAARSVYVISKDAAGRVSSSPAILIGDRPDAISFVEPPDESGAVWLYTLFPQAGRVIMSRHTHPFLGGPDAAMGSQMQAACRLGRE